MKRFLLIYPVIFAGRYLIVTLAELYLKYILFFTPTKLQNLNVFAASACICAAVGDFFF